jgi:Lysophospholipase
MGAQTQIEDDLATSGSGGAFKPTVVLVHGGLEDASIWHLVIPRLQSDGYPVVAFANPLRGLASTSPTCGASSMRSRAL